MVRGFAMTITAVVTAPSVRQTIIFDAVWDRSGGLTLARSGGWFGCSTRFGVGVW